MKIISVVFLAVVAFIGMRAGGDITGALVMAVLILPGVFGKGKKKDVLQCMSGVRCSTGPGRKM